MTPSRRSTNPVGRPRRPRTGAGAVDTRTQILDQTEVLLDERGYAGMSMDDVARAAGLTKGTLYHHFPEGKDALILAAAQRTLGRHRDGLAASIPAAHDVRGQLEAVADWTLASSGRADRILRDAARFLPGPAAEELTQAFIAQVYTQVHDVLRRGAERGELGPHDAELVAWAFLGLLAEFAGSSHIFTRPHLGRQLVALVLDGVGRREDLRPPAQEGPSVGPDPKELT